MPVKKQVELGMQVRDIVSGLTGIVISKAEYLNGCVRFGVEPKGTKTKVSESEWVDEQQLVIVKVDTPARRIVQKRVGGPRPVPRREKTPPRR